MCQVQASMVKFLQSLPPLLTSLGESTTAASNLDRFKRQLRSLNIAGTLASEW
jgi:hypothetical protein